MTVGVCGPIDLNLLHWNVPKGTLPPTNAFPLTSYFINALLRSGYKVIGYTNSRDVSEPTVVESGNLTICISREKPQMGRRFFKFEIEDLKRIIQAHPADVISAFWTYEYALAALGSGIPTIANIHDVASKILLKQPDMFRLVRWFMNNKVMQQSCTLVANSDYTYSQLSASTKEKTTVIPNFYPAGLEGIRQAVKHKGNYIISSSNGFTKRKNIHLALEAFQILRKVFPDLQYHLIGVDMEENGPAHQYASARGLADAVHFVGPLPYDRTLKEVANAKVLLCSSMEESFGMAILEAMVVGTAVVGGEKSGYVPSLVDKGKAGVLCNIYSPDSMADAVALLLGNKALRERYERAAANFAQEHFSEDVVIPQHLALLSKHVAVPVNHTQTFTV
ncbi:glycosyltransferase involved in cell wall biosynthesis [Pontibacter ummariensis]|uniref:Glycosyltransferase involved in cell wall bisynthesis n=2 Tax=Pontibacter ummariensis TaxID=1610492 RepID=A0A239GGY2_9BACT|nr:glycosyltransferase involved in cell wall biosynthesis [Pontibacter ummariensis]SNS68012.1 Glycosyltransferase involved in cell wall bisynthesis [Pontibacter ummariensis]